MPQLPPELSQAIFAAGGLPVRVVDPQSQRIFVLTEQTTTSADHAAWIRNEIDRGLAAIDRGEVADWAPERIKTVGRQQLADRRHGAD